MVRSPDGDGDVWGLGPGLGLGLGLGPGEGRRCFCVVDRAEPRLCGTRNRNGIGTGPPFSLALSSLSPSNDDVLATIAATAPAAAAVAPRSAEESQDKLRHGPPKPAMQPATSDQGVGVVGNSAANCSRGCGPNAATARRGFEQPG